MDPLESILRALLPILLARGTRDPLFEGSRVRADARAGGEVDQLAAAMNACRSRGDVRVREPEVINRIEVGERLPLEHAPREATLVYRPSLGGSGLSPSAV